MGFVVPAEYRVNIKENEKLGEDLNSLREVKNLWNMNITVLLVEVGTLV